MKMKQWKWLAAMLGLAMGAGIYGASGATLRVGDPAPKLQTGDWVQGEPVKAFDSDQAYIVEFWATWCGPCRVSIPHLNEVYKKFKDKKLVVIGQDCWEQEESKVAPFVKQMGEKMTYRVALDDKEGSKKGKMAETWMEAAGQNGIPTAFLVNKEGKIAWIGHPMELKDEVIEQVLAGTFDLAKNAAEYDERQKAKEKARAEMEKKQAPLREASQRLQQAMQKKDWDKAEAAVAEIEKLLPEENRAGLNSARLQIAFGRGDDAATAKLAESLSSAQPDNAMLQNDLAWQLAIHDGIKGELLATAVKIGERANTASDQKNPMILDTVARLAFLQGDKAKAIELETKAVELAEADMKSQMQDTLDSYKQGKLPKAQ
jgi:thiol-disulfide isomerase/thioredoxin